MNVIQTAYQLSDKMKKIDLETVADEIEVLRVCEITCDYCGEERIQLPVSTKAKRKDIVSSMHAVLESNSWRTARDAYGIVCHKCIPKLPEHNEGE